MKLNGVDVFDPNSGEVRSDNADGIACWFIDTDYSEFSVKLHKREMGPIWLVAQVTSILQECPFRLLGTSK